MAQVTDVRVLPSFVICKLRDPYLREIRGTMIKSSASTEYSHKDPPSIECVSVTDDLKPAVTHTHRHQEREGGPCGVSARLC
ncbi:hypothetical protein EYF80_058852 [Liparis tanakae]|uniref:Uncharacterized protein n=1 Tax=Liparis tanakae TaxID=230148 RepID=A0A4Z2EQC1_9TELE|nr:hypothetical protein EYF80_058852 [Liparis tanakae]